MTTTLNLLTRPGAAPHPSLPGTRRRGRPGVRTSPVCAARRHGDYSAYRQGCRCPEAREDERLYTKRRRQGRRTPLRAPRIGTARRLQALAAIGWRWTDLAAALDVGTWQAVQNIATRRRGEFVNTSTAERVAALYRRLSSTPGPSEPTRERAAEKGWPPPDAWDDIDDPTALPWWTPPGAQPSPDAVDEVVDGVLVDLVLRGHRPYSALNAAEQVALMRAWTRRHDEMEGRPGVAEFRRTFGVTKHRAEALRLAAAGLNTRSNPTHPDPAASAGQRKDAA